MSIPCQALQQREAAAWDEFYQEHVQELYGFVFRLVRGDHPAAADVFQDTWLDAIDHIEQFDPTRGELRTWLFAIARRRVALYWRKRISSNPIRLAGQLDHAAESEDGAILPDEVVEQLERAAVVRASLLAIPPDHRQMLTDKYVEGLSLEQIAAKTGKSLKSVESRLSRGREQLRSLLRWYFSDPKGGKGS
jgi:RNA polymerase sigma-70 factor (ECF subfamily)